MILVDSSVWIDSSTAAAPRRWSAWRACWSTAARRWPWPTSCCSRCCAASATSRTTRPRAARWPRCRWSRSAARTRPSARPRTTARWGARHHGAQPDRRAARELLHRARLRAAARRPRLRRARDDAGIEGVATLMRTLPQRPRHEPRPRASRRPRRRARLGQRPALVRPGVSSPAGPASRLGGAAAWPAGLRTRCAVGRGLMLVVEFLADKVPFFNSLWTPSTRSSAFRPGRRGGRRVRRPISSPWALIAALAGGTLAATAHARKATTRAALTPRPSRSPTSASSLVRGRPGAGDLVAGVKQAVVSSFVASRSPRWTVLIVLFF